MNKKNKEEIPKGYKFVKGIGVIPEDWEVKKIKILCDKIQDGTHNTPKYTNEGIPFLSVENITNNNFKDTKFISKEEHKIISKRCLPEKNDILLTRIGTLGKAKLVDWDKEYSIYVSLALLKLKKEINSKFIFQYISGNVFYKDLLRKSLLLAVPMKINLKDIGDILSLLPEYSEQTRIADCLFLWDKAIDKQKELIENKKQYKKGIMQNLLTGRIRFPEFKKAPTPEKPLSEYSENDVPTGYKYIKKLGVIPEDWEVKKIKILCDKIQDGTHNTPKYTNEGIPFLSVENITNNNFEDTKFISKEEHKIISKRCLPKKNDILLTRIGTLGKAKLVDWDKEYSIYVSLALLKLKKEINSKFIFQYISGNVFYKDLLRKSLLLAVPMKINLKDIGDILSLLPDYSEQTRIADCLSKYDKEIEFEENKLKELELQKKGLMQKLLVGKVRFPEFIRK